MRYPITDVDGDEFNGADYRLVLRGPNVEALGAARDVSLHFYEISKPDASGVRTGKAEVRSPPILAGHVYLLEMHPVDREPLRWGGVVGDA